MAKLLSSLASPSLTFYDFINPDCQRRKRRAAYCRGNLRNLFVCPRVLYYGLLYPFFKFICRAMRVSFG